MRTRLLVPISVSLALFLAACGGSSGTSSSPTSQAPGTTAAIPPGLTPTTHVAKLASNVPSVSAKMICEDEAANDIYEQATGVKTVAPFKPTWKDHVYSCDYVYAGGAQFTLSVKEVSSTQETTAYFDSLATKLGKTKVIAQIGQGAFQTADGSVVVRKDYKVLTVDVSKLPAQFGVPSDKRGNVAINVAAAIMSCWVGE